MSCSFRLVKATQKLLEGLWYGNSLFSVLLAPLALLYKLALACRKRMIAAPAAFPIPIIVVGNLTVGGGGKTPMVIYLASILRANGLRPGIISRGYGGGENKYPRLVAAGDSVADCGDEAIMLAAETDCPVVICRDRYRAASYLIKNKNVDLLLSDDGLQHYGLPRQVEILMIDGRRGFGNGRLLPAGPLREPLSRINAVDLKVVKDAYWQNCYRMDLLITGFVELSSGRELGPKAFSGREIHACAGIANPESFLQSLTNLGARCVSHVFPDHYLFKAKDLSFHASLPIVMTQKDVARCGEHLREHFSGELWYAKTEARLENGFSKAFMRLLSDFFPERFVYG